MKIGITGATSSIGMTTVREAIAQGHEVVRFVRSPNQVGDRRFNLGDEISKEDFSDLDALIHLAWDRSKNDELSALKNIESGKKLFLICESSEVKIVFLSSFSASSNSASLYGKSKFQLEKICLSLHGTVLRAGVIWGSEWAGILKSIKSLSKLPIICPHISPEPILYHSNQIDLAAELVRNAVNDPVNKVLLSANQVPIQLSKISHAIRGNIKSIHFKVAIKLIVTVATFIRFIKLPLPFSPDSIRSLITPMESTDLHSFSKGFSTENDLLKWLMINS